mgnify:CR=1 FL=1
MEKEEINNEQTKRLDFAGKKVTSAGNVFLLLPVLVLVQYIIISQYPKEADLLQGVSIGAPIIYCVLLIVIGAELRAAGQGLRGIFSENEYEKRMKNL